MRRTTIVLLACLGALVTLAIFFLPTSAPVEWDVLPPVQVGPSIEVVVDKSDGDQQRSPVNVAALQWQVGDAVRLRLVDATLGTPVLGQVLGPGGEVLGESDLEGQLVLAEIGDPLPTLIFTASGYRRVSRAPEPADLAGEWVVELVPELVSSVIAEDELGNRIEGVEVRIGPKPPRKASLHVGPSAERPESWPLAGMTGAEGRFEFALARMAVAELRSSQNSVALVQLSPGESARVVLQRQPAILRFVDSGSGQAIPGFLVATRDGLASRELKVQRQANARGELTVPAGRRKWIVQLLDPTRSDAHCADDPRVTVGSEGYEMSFEALLPGEVVTVHVERCGVLLQLVDAVTGMPLVAVAEVDYERFREHKDKGVSWRPRTILHQSMVLDDGGLALGCLYLPKLRDENARRRERLRLVVEGYRPTWLTGADLEENAPRREVQLVPGARLVRVQVLYADGVPFAGKLRLRDGVSRSVSITAEPDSKGCLPAIDWGGGEIQVSCSRWKDPKVEAASPFDPERDQNKEGSFVLGTVPAADIVDGQARLVLPYAPARCALEVRGVPQGAPALVAIDLEGARRRSTRIGDVARFVDLPPGLHLIGSTEWVVRVEGQVEWEAWDRFAVTLVGGEERSIDWDPQWWLTDEIRGRITCAPESMAELFLRPWYGGREVRVPPKDDLRIHLDQDGGYLIPVGEPRPELLLVCKVGSDSWTPVLMALEPGQDAHVALGTVVVEWGGAPASGSNSKVSYRCGHPDLGVPFTNQRHTRDSTDWNRLSPLTLSAVPIGVTELRVSLKGYAQAAFPLVVHEGGVTRIQVQADRFDPLPPPDPMIHEMHMRSHQAQHR